ncbi:armadillo-type protein [Rhodocollybia butyracea]|uniref:Armadillo-type protein n=1 Tax=Rhodocollybia butyracea TaxID=206335 RepID=A0A9P5TVW3_9AGAR|nr:armadillo-type protein [Rhodocollybia butyracea]
MAWNPQPTALQEVLTIIHETTENNVPLPLDQILNNLTRQPEYAAYLAHILTAMPQEDESIRSVAAYLLKNNARLILDASPEEYVKSALLRALGGDSVMIRAAAGPVILSFLGVLEPRNWPECLSQLVKMLDCPDLEKQEAALDVLEKACEDYPRKLDVEIGGTRPLDLMIPIFLSFTDHQSSKMRSHAVACLSNFVHVNFECYADTFMRCLLRRTIDQDPSVRRPVCRAFVSLALAYPQMLIPEMGNVAEFMLDAMQDKDENIALPATEFWLTVSQNPGIAPSLRLNKVAPALLDRIIHYEDIVLCREGDADHPPLTDTQPDNKPRQYGAKSRGFDRDARSEPSAEAPKPCIEAYGEETIDWDDDDEFRGDESNIRRCAAKALDALARHFDQGLLDVLLAPLKDKLGSNDWLQRESGILALGAISEGCIKAIEPHLPTFVPYLINALDDSTYLVRSTSCWTLGSYVEWIAQPISDEHQQKYFVPTMKGLLRMVLDNNKEVQEAGCCTFVTLEEAAGIELAPYIELILHDLLGALDMYDGKNLLLLYDAIATLADVVGRKLSNSIYVELLMPPLTDRWAKLKDEDVKLTPLLECLASVAIALGQAFLPYGPPLFRKCYSTILHYQQYQQNPDLEEPDKPSLVAALSLLAGLTQGLGMSLESLISQSQPNLLMPVTTCLRHPKAAVRQSAYALVGEMAVSCFTLLKPHIPGIMAQLMLQLDSEPVLEFVDVSNNAAWSAGEVALRCGRDDPEFRHWVPSLISRLILILLDPEASSLHVNAAVSIGRIGLRNTDLVAPRLPEFALAWCTVMYDITDNEEKESAFRGLCTMLRVNPAGISKSLLWVCNIIVHWTQPSPPLNKIFATALQTLKRHDETSWSAQVAAFPPLIQEQLATRYGV